MKRILLFTCCALLLVLTGCTAVNQTNRFVEMPSDETEAATATPESTAMPEVTQPPVITQPPVVELVVQPTASPGAADTPAPSQDATITTVPTDTPAPSDTPVLTDVPTQAPENNPGGGFNG